jgi:hypothetical protein
MVALQHGYAFEYTNRRISDQRNPRSYSLSFICILHTFSCLLTVYRGELILTKMKYTRLSNSPSRSKGELGSEASAHIRVGNSEVRGL